MPPFFSALFSAAGWARQGKFDAALQDYNAAIRLAPYAVDPVLNRGVALEAVGRLAEAAADYRPGRGEISRDLMGGADRA